MAKQTINTGSSNNDGTGDTLRAAGVKINANFTELYADVATIQATGATDSELSAAVSALNAAITANSVSQQAYTDTAVTGMATQEYVGQQIAAQAHTDAQTLSLNGTELVISGGNTINLAALDTQVDLTGYATETYVDDALSGLANTSYVDTAVSGIAFANLSSTPTTVAGYGITDAFNGQYSSLTGAPTNVSAFSNDAGYLTSGTDSQTLTWDEGNTAIEISNGNSIVITGFATQSYVDQSISVIADSDNQTLSWVPTTRTLSITGGNSKELTGLATETWVQEQGYTTQTVVLDDYATILYVDEQVANVSIDLAGYATEQYVTTAVSGYATEQFVTTAVSGFASETYVDTAVANVSINDLTDVDTTGLVDGSVLKYNGVGWAVGIDADTGGSTTLTGLTDVNTTGVADSSILVYNATATEWEIGSLPGATAVNDISDVTITAAQNGDVLKYNEGTGIWENSPDAGGIALTDLSVGADAAASGSGDVAYDNTSGVFTYTPPVIPAALTDLGITDGTVGQVLSTNGSGVFTFTNAGGATVAGANTQIQFNNSGALGASPNLTFNDGTKTLTANRIAADSFESTATGVPSITSATDIELLVGNRVKISNGLFRMPRLTNATVALLTATEGDMYYSTDDNVVKCYVNSPTTGLGWVDLTS